MSPTGAVKAAKSGYIVISSLLCVLGILLIIFPRISSVLLCIVIGVFLTAYGIFKLVGYFSKDLFRLAFQFDLAYGIFTLVFGLLMLIFPSRFAPVMYFAVGLIVFSDGLFKIQISIDSKVFGIKQWWLIAMTAVIACSLGLLLIIDPFTGANALMVMLGVSLMADGLLNLIVMAYAVKIIKKSAPIDVDYTIDDD